ncbi:MAG: SLBB domain-containing protein [Nitrospirota bacterium]|nr:SLBB domain-containing protein [Nitrospirota bacterium]
MTQSIDKRTGKKATTEAPEQTRHLLRHLEHPNIHRLADYRKAGGYSTVQQVLGKVSREDLTEWLAVSNLRGRGGAGQPVAKKWRRVADVPGQRYVIANGDESEPGAFKDRELMECNPHQLIEGLILSAYAVKATRAIIYIRLEYELAQERVGRALKEAEDAGIIGGDVMGTGVEVEFEIFVSGGAYICGEQTALIESVEGKLPYPRPKPPYPTVYGLWGRPTVVQNIETLSAIPVVVGLGPENFAAIGSPLAPGPKVYSVSGHVSKPGNYELPMGTTLRQLIAVCGGISEGRRFKAALPGGAASGFLTEDHLDLPLDFESLKAMGGEFGTGTVMIFDQHTCMVGAAQSLLRFFHDESCGKCTPCREGTRFMFQWLTALETGHGSQADIDALARLSGAVPGTTCCALADGACLPVATGLMYFMDEFTYHAQHGTCPPGEEHIHLPHDDVQGAFHDERAPALSEFHPPK